MTQGTQRGPSHPYHEENRWIVTDHRYNLHRNPRTAYKEAGRLTETFGRPYAVVRVKDNGGLFYGLPSHRQQNAEHAEQAGEKRGKIRCTVYETDQDHLTIAAGGKIIFDADVGGATAEELMSGVFSALLGDLADKMEEMFSAPRSDVDAATDAAADTSSAAPPPAAAAAAPQRGNGATGHHPNFKDFNDASDTGPEHSQTDAG